MANEDVFYFGVVAKTIVERKSSSSGVAEYSCAAFVLEDFEEYVCAGFFHGMGFLFLNAHFYSSISMEESAIVSAEIFILCPSSR